MLKGYEDKELRIYQHKGGKVEPIPEGMHFEIAWKIHGRRILRKLLREAEREGKPYERKGNLIRLASGEVYRIADDGSWRRERPEAFTLQEPTGDG